MGRGGGGTVQVGEKSGREQEGPVCFLFSFLLFFWGEEEEWNLFSIECTSFEMIHQPIRYDFVLFIFSCCLLMLLFCLFYCSFVVFVFVISINKT